MEKPIFSTKLSKIDLLTVMFYIGLGVFSLYCFRHIFFEKLTTKNTVVLLIPALFILQGIRIAKIFVLYSDRIIIRRPFIFFTRIFDVVYKFDELKDVSFRTVNTIRNRNDFVIFQTKITTYKTGESYVLNDRNQMDLLIMKLNDLGIKTVNELK